MLFRRNPEFAKFWFGESVSLVGSNVTLLALPLTVVLTLGATPQQLGLVRFFESIPLLLFALVFGAWADRYPRKPVMIASNAVRALLVGALPVLAITQTLNLNIVYVIAFLVGTAAVMFEVCWAGFVPSIVAQDDLVDANAKLTTSFAAADVAGPGLAGVLVQLLSAPLALALNAASYLVSVVTLALVRVDEPRCVPAASNLFGEIGAGLRFVAGNRYLRPLVYLAALWNFFHFCIETTFILYAVRELRFSAGTLGFVMSAGAVGGLLGAVFAARLQRRVALGPLLCATFVCGSAPWIILPAAHGAASTLASAFTCTFFFVRLALGVWSVLTLTLRQTVTPPAMLSRSTASGRLLSYAAQPAGAMTAGALATAFGLHATLWIAAGGYLALLIPLALSPLPRLRALPAHAEDAA